MGADCKSVGFTFSGSNPLSATSNTMGLQLGAHSLSGHHLADPVPHDRLNRIGIYPNFAEHQTRPGKFG
jgi:hypothetical protein